MPHSVKRVTVLVPLKRVTCVKILLVSVFLCWFFLYFLYRVYFFVEGVEKHYSKSPTLGKIFLGSQSVTPWVWVVLVTWEYYCRCACFRTSRPSYFREHDNNNHFYWVYDLTVILCSYCTCDVSLAPLYSSSMKTRSNHDNNKRWNN